MPFDNGPESSGGGGGDRDEQLISYVMDTLMEAIEASDNPEYIMCNVMLSSVGTFVMNVAALPGMTADETFKAAVGVIERHYEARRGTLQEAIENLLRARDGA